MPIYSIIWRGLRTAVLVTMLWAMAVQTGAAGTTYAFQVDGLACPFCAYGIEKQFHKLEGVASISMDIKTGTVTITMEDGVVLEEIAAKRAVDKAGFTLRGFKQKENIE